MRTAFDLARGAERALVDRGWAIHRYTKFDVYGERDRIVAELARARRSRSP
jgi:hypothetical protein